MTATDPQLIDAARRGDQTACRRLFEAHGRDVFRTCMRLLGDRALAEERLVARLASALHVDPPRRKTRPSRGAKERRLQAKKARSQTKANRQRPGRDG